MHTRSKTIKYSFIRSHVLLLSGSLEYVSIIRFQVIKLKFLCEAFKNEKWKILAWYSQTKCGDITNEILNVAIDAERTLKCKWPKCLILHCLFKIKDKNHAWHNLKSLNTYFLTDCMLLSCHIRVSEWIQMLYLHECQGTPYSKRLQLGLNPQPVSGQFD